MIELSKNDPNIKKHLDYIEDCNAFLRATNSYKWNSHRSQEDREILVRWIRDSIAVVTASMGEYIYAKFSEEKHKKETADK